MCQQFEYLHQKFRCKMLIGQDLICRRKVYLSRVCNMFVYIDPHFWFVLFGKILAAHAGSQKPWEH